LTVGEALAHPLGDGIDRTIAAVDQRIEQARETGAAIGEEAELLALGDQLAGSPQGVGVEADQGGAAMQPPGPVRHRRHQAVVREPVARKPLTLKPESLAFDLELQPTAREPRIVDRIDPTKRGLDRDRHRPQDRALPAVVRPDERLQRPELELHVLDAAKALDVNSLDARHRARVWLKCARP